MIIESKQLIDLLSSRSPFWHALIWDCMLEDQIVIVLGEELEELLNPNLLHETRTQQNQTLYTCAGFFFSWNSGEAKQEFLHW